MPTVEQVYDSDNDKNEAALSEASEPYSDGVPGVDERVTPVLHDDFDGSSTDSDAEDYELESIEGTGASQPDENAEHENDALAEAEAEADMYKVCV